MEKFSLLTALLSNEENELLENMVKNPHFSLPSFQIFKGRHIIPNFSPKAMEYVHDKWNVKASDVFVVSYPKTGTTWMGEIARQILYPQNEAWLDLGRRSPLPLRYPELGDVNKFSIVDKLPYDRRVFCTHMTPDLINFDKIKKANAKVIVVYRNPKDQIVSFLKFLQAIPMKDTDPLKSMFESGWEKYLDHVLKGDFLMNNKPGEWYPEFLLSWYHHRDNETVCFVAFEDLKKDLFKEVKKIASFLEKPVDEKTAETIANACGIQNMKKVNEKTGAKLEPFLRKGDVGGWKDYFTVSQSERVDAIMDEKLKDTDIKFTYEL